jgi:lysyl-tRNA synthetase class 2
MPDQTWRPTATHEALRARAALLERARGFLRERGVVEVEPPALSAAAPPDLHLAPLAVAGHGWLHTSPEYALKRLVAAGFGDCFALGKVWRDGERGRNHNPEFTMLEWYRVGWDHLRLMDEVAALIAELLAPRVQLAAPERLTYREAFEQHLGFDPLSASDRMLDVHLTNLGLDDQLCSDRDAKLDLLASHLVYPKLGHGRVTLLHDYPASQCMLARIRPARAGAPAVAERFEAFVDGLELANGYHELGDAAEQRARLDAAAAARAAAGLPAVALDARFVAALAHGLPDCAGVALGFDRVVMLSLGAERIDQVIAFPAERA